MKKRALYFLLGILLLTGCSQRILIPSSPTLIEKDGVLFILEPYSEKLEKEFQFGRDYSDLNYNTSFLFTVQNNSDKVVSIFPTLKSAIVDNLGRQYLPIVSPQLPSLDRIEIKEIYSTDPNLLLSPVEGIEEDLKNLYQRQNVLRSDIENLQRENKKIPKAEREKRRLEFEQQMLEVETHILEKRKNRLIRKDKARNYRKAKFKDGEVFPKALVRGLIVYEALSGNTSDITVIIPPSEEMQKSLLKYRFRVENH